MKRASRVGVLKRPPAIGKARAFHEGWSKSTIHEALVDLWLESNGLDIHPGDMTPEQVEAYRADVERRADLRQGTE